MTRIQVRRGTAAQWTAANPILTAGEHGFETDTGKEKIGTGSTAWVALPYAIDTGGTTAALATKADATTTTAALNTKATVNPSGFNGTPVQGLYARTRPAPDAGGALIRPMVKDPNVAGRLWCIGSAFGQFGFTDDDGATWTAKGIPETTDYACQDIQFGGGYAWATVSQQVDKKARIRRSPIPDSAGNGWSWSTVLDLEAPPGGITTGDHAIFRHSNLAVSGSNVYVVEYSNTPITGGPSLYYSANSGATWTKTQTWANGKHCHAVKVIGGVPWVMIGDVSAAFTDIGLWTATSAAATVWNRRSLYGPLVGGNYLYGINFFPATVDSVPMVIAEYDGMGNYGPLLFATQDPTVNRVLAPSCQLPQTYTGTNRQLTLTSEGNLMWLHTSESLALGTRDSIWISKPPFTSAVLLETFAPTGDSDGNPVENGNYVWFGRSRVRKEKFLGQ